MDPYTEALEREGVLDSREARLVWSCDPGWRSMGVVLYWVEGKRVLLARNVDLLPRKFSKDKWGSQEYNTFVDAIHEELDLLATALVSAFLCNNCEARTRLVIEYQFQSPMTICMHMVLSAWRAMMPYHPDATPDPVIVHRSDVLREFEYPRFQGTAAQKRAKQKTHNYEVIERLGEPSARELCTNEHTADAYLQLKCVLQQEAAQADLIQKISEVAGAASDA